MSKDKKIDDKDLEVVSGSGDYNPPDMEPVKEVPSSGAPGHPLPEDDSSPSGDGNATPSQN